MANTPVKLVTNPDGSRSWMHVQADGSLTPVHSLRPPTAAELDPTSWLGGKGGEAYNAGLGASSDPMARQLATLTYEKQRNPDFQMPTGFVDDGQGNVIVDPGSWLERYGPFLALAAAAGGIGLSSLGAFGGGAATSIPTSTMGDLASVGAIGTEAAPGALASTTIGTGALGPIAGGTGSGSGMSFLDTVKSIYDLTKKGSQVYDSVKDLANPGNAMTPAGQIGQTAGSIEQQRLKALIAEIQAQQRQDQLAQSRSKLALAAPGAEAQNSVQGDILANGQDASISGLPRGVTVPNISGGLRPSMLSSNSRALGANMSRNALLNNLSGKDVPDLTPLPSSNAFDKILQGTAIGGGFLNAANGLFKRFTHGTGEISGFLPNNTGGPTDGTMPYPLTPPELLDPNDPNNPNYILHGYGG